MTCAACALRHGGFALSVAYGWCGAVRHMGVTLCMLLGVFMIGVHTEPTRQHMMGWLCCLDPLGPHCNGCGVSAHGYPMFSLWLASLTPQTSPAFSCASFSVRRCIALVASWLARQGLSALEASILVSNPRIPTAVVVGGFYSRRLLLEVQCEAPTRGNTYKLVTKTSYDRLPLITGSDLRLFSREP